MDPSSQNIISQDKLEQAALLYGLTDPFFEPQEALNFAKERNKYAKRAAKNNDNLRTLLVFADLLNLNIRTRDIETIEKKLITADNDIKNAAILHCLTSKGELSPLEAIHKVKSIDEELKPITKCKDLRTLTILGMLVEKNAEPVNIAKTLFSIQKLFNMQKKRER